MFGFEFLFGLGLLALPLAGLPVLLHLVFKRKSPTVHFSTLRFIKSSVQHTAARKRLQRWLLLAVRTLLLAFLIWAISQPARKLASQFLGSGGNGVAVVVADNSYSMEASDKDVTRLSRVNDIVQSLLRDDLRDAKVAVISNEIAPEEAISLHSASDLLGQWQPLTAHASALPLAERINRAVELLRRQNSDQKWLVILTDLQAWEFARPLPAMDDLRVILIDLHPGETHNAGIIGVKVQPEQPIPGITAQAAVQVAGTPGESRAVTVTLQKVGGTPLVTVGPQMATLDAGGQAEIRLPVNFPAERWTILRATLGANDDMAWDNTRAALVEIPPRQTVTVVTPAQPRPAARMIRLALDPSEGKVAAWPLDVRPNINLTGDENVVVLPMFTWPDENTTVRVLDFAKMGGTVVTFVQPGIESAFESLPPASRDAWAQMLPSAPLAIETSGSYQAIASAQPGDLIKGLTDEQFQLNTIIARRIVAFSPNESGVLVILNASPTHPTGGTRLHGLVYRRNVGQGVVYTVATMPETRFSNLGTHPIFLPLLVRMSMRPTEQGSAQNVEVGQPLTLTGQRFSGYAELDLENPSREISRVARLQETGMQLHTPAVKAPGLYLWRKLDDANPVAITNVQLPADEAELDYRDARSVVPDNPNVLIASSLEDLKAKITSLAEPEPRWSWAIALVLVLICVEALMASTSKLWKRPAWTMSGVKPA